MIRVVHPGSRIRMLTFSHPRSRIKGSKRHPIPDPDPQHCQQVVNWNGYGMRMQIRILLHIEVIQIY